MVVGVFFLHRSLARNEDENMVVREGAARQTIDTKESALEALKKPLPQPPKAMVDSQSVAMKPSEIASKGSSLKATPLITLVTLKPLM